MVSSGQFLNHVKMAEGGCEENYMEVRGMGGPLGGGGRKVKDLSSHPSWEVGWECCPEI